MATGGTTTRHNDLDGQHNNGGGWHTTATGRTATRHGDGKGQQGNRRHDDEGRTGGATMRGAAARQGRQRRRDDEGRTMQQSASAMMKAAVARQ